MSSGVERLLEEAVKSLIAQGVDEFWLCEQGAFDCLSRLVMKKLKKEYGYISLCLLPAYHPSDAKADWIDDQDYDLIFPDEVAKAPPRIAILRRNKYIAENADFIICYVAHNYGGAYKTVKLAKKNGKTIINLAECI